MDSIVPIPPTIRLPEPMKLCLNYIHGTLYPCCKYILSHPNIKSQTCVCYFRMVLFSMLGSLLIEVKEAHC